MTRLAVCDRVALVEGKLAVIYQPHQSARSVCSFAFPSTRKRLNTGLAFWFLVEGTSMSFKVFRITKALENAEFSVKSVTVDALPANGKTVYLRVTIDDEPHLPILRADLKTAIRRWGLPLHFASTGHPHEWNVFIAVPLGKFFQLCNTWEAYNVR